MQNVPLECDGLNRTEEGRRETGGASWAETILQDVRYGARMLRKNPGVSLVALLTLALGIGANTAIFSVVSAVLLKPLPYPHAERIVYVFEKRPDGGRSSLSPLNYLDYAHQNDVFERMAAVTGVGSPMTARNGSLPVQLQVLRVSSPYFDVLGIKPALGRTFVAGEDQRGHDHVAVISHALWASQFGSDPALVGRSIRLNAELYTVIGVMPAGSAFDRGWNDAWLPLSFGPDNTSRNSHWVFFGLAVMKPGVTLERARREMDVIGARVAHEYPASNNGWGVIVDPFADLVVGKQLRQSLLLLLGAVGMVLLIGCINLANVMLARGFSRQREVSIRLALGAGRGRLVQQFLTESVLLSLTGGLLGLAMGYATVTILKTALPPSALPAEASVEVDASVLIFTLTISVLSGIVSGLVPAIAMTRAAVAPLPLGEGHRISRSGSYRRLSGTLIVTEVALAFVLLTSAGLLIRSFFNLRDVDAGFNAANVLTAGLPVPGTRFSDPVALNRYLGQVVASIESIPGVRAVALTDALPMQGVFRNRFFQRAEFPPVARANQPFCRTKIVSPSYFRALDLRVRAGRALGDRDAPGSPLVTVVNETMANMYFPGEDPVGKRLLMEHIPPGATAGAEALWEIVGVVADEHVNPVGDQGAYAVVYVSNQQSPTSLQQLVVRTAFDPSRFQESIRHAVAAVDQDQVVADMASIQQIRSESMGSDRLRSALFGVFAAVALLLSASGIYGVISHGVAQRTNEIGIRAALGATSTNLLGLVLRHGMALSGMGLILGLPTTLGVTRLLKTFLFGVGSSDPVTVSAAAGILACVAAIACYIPARHATRIDPIAALRAE